MLKNYSHFEIHDRHIFGPGVEFSSPIIRDRTAVSAREPDLQPLLVMGPEKEATDPIPYLRFLYAAVGAMQCNISCTMASY